MPVVAAYRFAGAEKENEKMSTSKKQSPSRFKKYFRWPLLVLVISFTMSMTFGVLSEIALSGAGIAVSIIVILVFAVVAIITDMIGVAVTACEEKPFRAMASKKVRGAKEAIMLHKNADRVASIIADIVGDVCSILSGAAGATVTAALINDSMSEFLTIIIASLVSAVIAALIIFGKSLMKRYSLDHCSQIILVLGKILSVFHPQHNQKKKAEDGKKDDGSDPEKPDGQDMDDTANIQDSVSKENSAESAESNNGAEKSATQLDTNMQIKETDITDEDSEK